MQMQNPNSIRNLNINISKESLIRSLGSIQNNKNNTIYNNNNTNNNINSIMNLENFLSPNLLQGTNKNLMNNLNKFKSINSTSANGFK